MGAPVADEIATRTAEGRVYFVRRGDEILGRIVDRTPYTRVVPASEPGHPVAESTDPSLRAFEPQFTDHRGGFEPGPLFLTLEDARQWFE